MESQTIGIARKMHVPWQHDAKPTDWQPEGSVETVRSGDGKKMAKKMAQKNGKKMAKKWEKRNGIKNGKKGMAKKWYKKNPGKEENGKKENGKKENGKKENGKKENGKKQSNFPQGKSAHAGRSPARCTWLVPLG